ncbi:hypothetical protein BCR34DRAFT_666721 [Clohesyomyces aquaticus]|uniref:Uncharacterized protein n=1 Tax=Clohesyomyces aquaticus TaxID=1231657 RepID=A0A1Y1Z6W3_9PLEO|nr:hypothetical protein BCR34DRAFT_666721 [Clohesyomyces aquaticus]
MEKGGRYVIFALGIVIYNPIRVPMGWAGKSHSQSIRAFKKENGLESGMRDSEYHRQSQSSTAFFMFDSGNCVNATRSWETFWLPPKDVASEAGISTGHHSISCKIGRTTVEYVPLRTVTCTAYTVDLLADALSSECSTAKPGPSVIALQNISRGGTLRNVTVLRLASHNAPNGIIDRRALEPFQAVDELEILSAGSGSSCPGSRNQPDTCTFKIDMLRYNSYPSPTLERGAGLLTFRSILSPAQNYQNVDQRRTPNLRSRSLRVLRAPQRHDHMCVIVSIGPFPSLTLVTAFPANARLLHGNAINGRPRHYDIVTSSRVCSRGEFRVCLIAYEDTQKPGGKVLNLMKNLKDAIMGNILAKLHTIVVIADLDMKLMSRSYFPRVDEPCHSGVCGTGSCEGLCTPLQHDD